MVAADLAMLRASPAGMAPNPARDPGRLSNPARVDRPMVTDRCGRRPCRVNTWFPPRRVAAGPFAAAPAAVFVAAAVVAAPAVAVSPSVSVVAAAPGAPVVAVLLVLASSVRSV